MLVPCGIMMRVSVLFVVILASVKGSVIADITAISKIGTLLNQVLNAMQNDSSVCGSHIQFYIEQLNQSYWAMKMFDSSTKIPESVLMYQLVHLGNFDECLSVEGVSGPANDSFDAQYCMVSLSLSLGAFKNKNPFGTSRAIMREMQFPDAIVEVQRRRPEGRNVPLQTALVLQMAYCLPSSCSPEMIRYYFNETANSIFSFMSVPEVSCSQGSRGRSLQTEDWIAMTILIIFGCICIMSTTYDLFTENKKRQEILTAFSWYSNGKKLLATSDTGSDTLHALHGIRFISMSWVVLGHALSVASSLPSVNAIIIPEFWQDFWRLYITSATLSVDTFFFLSGLLVCYVFLKQMNKTKNSSFNIPLYYFHRYIRLTPPYAIVILFQATLFRYVGTGPLWNWYIPMMADDCQTKWWTEILYVNNYVEPNKMCLGQGWYLAVDMQLFILSPIVLIPLWKWSRKLSLSFLGVLILCGLSAAFSVSYIKEFPASMANANTDMTQMQYYPTHTRVTPWLIGILFGYIIYETKMNKISISRMYALLGWLIAATALLGSLLGIYPFNQPNSHMSTLENSFYTSLSRSVWAVGVGWVTFACVSGVGGPINTFLSWKVFQPLSRLTYCVYLLHATWQIARGFSARTPGYLGDIVFIPTFLGDLAISLLLAVILSLCFESPIIILEKHLLGSGNTSKVRLQDSENSKSMPGPEAAQEEIESVHTSK